MAGSSRDLQRKERTAARVAAAQEARHKATVRRRNITIGAIGGAALLLLFGLVFWNAARDDDDATTTADGSTTVPSGSSTVPGQSAADKPCVAPVDPLPPGAPTVPVQVGPPPTQLIQEDLVEGTGATVTATDTVTANYIGVSCSTGKIFDSSYSRGEPATFPLSDVIPGWTEGLPGMKVGGQRLLGIPSEMAYGPTGRLPDILPDETLWFVVEMVATQPTP